MRNKVIKGPVRHIFLRQDKSPYMTELYELAQHARLLIHDNVKERWDLKGYHKIVYESGDELIMIDYEDDAPIKALKQHEVLKYSNKMFVDNKLPDSVPGAYLRKFGFIDYMVSIGLCSERSSSK